MALILNIDTSTSVCSVALSENGLVIAYKEVDEANIHASALTLFIEDVFKQSGTKLSNIDAVAVSKGPGSYTGLRIGVSIAKGLCYSLEKPLIAINTLQSLAWGVLDESSLEEGLLCPMIDARRMEVYAAVYDKDLNELRETQADIIDEESYINFLATEKVYFFGNGAAKCQELLSRNEYARFLDNVKCSARYLGNIAEQKFQQSDFESVAYFEPFYLKDFVAGKKAS